MERRRMIQSVLKSIGTMFQPKAPAVKDETRADAVYTPNDFWSEINMGGKSAAGVTVTHRSALAVPAVLQAVTMISGDVAKLPLDLWRRIEDSSGEEIERKRERNHPARTLTRRRPGFGLTPMVFFQTLMVHALLWGRGAAYIQRTMSGKPVALSILNPDHLFIRRRYGQTVFEYHADGRPEELSPDDVFYIPGLSLDGVEPIDTVYNIRDAIGLARAQLQFTSRSVKNGVTLSGVLTLPPGIQGTAKDAITKKVNEGMSPENQGKVLTLPDGSKLSLNSQTHRDAQLSELNSDCVRDVSRIFNLSPSRLGLSDAVSYNSKEEDNASYLDTTLSPWLEKIKQEADLKLLSSADDELYFEHNTGALLRMKPLDRAQVYSILTRCRVMKPSEARQRENLPPADGAEKWLDEAIQEEMPKTGGGADNAPADGGPVAKDSPMNVAR